MEEANQNTNKYVIETKNQDGTTVVLKPGTWSYKIAPKHEELTPALIQEGITGAHLIKPDSNHPNRYICYKIIPHPVEGVNHLTTIKVVIEKTSKEVNEIVTAHIVTDLSGESDKGGIIYDAGSGP